MKNKSKELQFAEDNLKEAARAYVESVELSFTSASNKSKSDFQLSIEKMADAWETLKEASVAFTIVNRKNYKG